jgi:hypothetical protein
MGTSVLSVAHSSNYSGGTMTKIEKANRVANLLLPKLEGYKNSCGGGDIHDVNVWIAIVRNNQKLMNTTVRQDPDEIADELIHAVNEATSWLVSVVSRSFG